MLGSSWLFSCASAAVSGCGSDQCSSVNSFTWTKHLQTSSNLPDSKPRMPGAIRRPGSLTFRQVWSTEATGSLNHCHDYEILLPLQQTKRLPYFSKKFSRWEALSTCTSCLLSTLHSIYSILTHTIGDQEGWTYPGFQIGVPLLSSVQPAGQKIQALGCGPCCLVQLLRTYLLSSSYCIPLLDPLQRTQVSHSRLLTSALHS